MIVALVIGILLVPRLLAYVARFESNEMLLITVLGLCFGFCLLVAKLEYSVVMGAFLIGAIMADLVLSGVNRGANLAEDVTYSGTVSAAIEGALEGSEATLRELKLKLAAAELGPITGLVNNAGIIHVTPLLEERARDWDATLAPLALLADAARTLPPVEDVPLTLPQPDGAHPDSDGAKPDSAAPTDTAPAAQPPATSHHDVDSGADLALAGDQ